jgi:hypothetical protein
MHDLFEIEPDAFGTIDRERVDELVPFLSEAVLSANWQSAGTR